MTDRGSFKRAVRAEARASGRRYTEALAELEARIATPFAKARPFDAQQVARHLAATYGVPVTSAVPIDDDERTRPHGSWPGHYPSTLVVRRGDGSTWIARVFSSAADRLERVEGDAEIIEFLAQHGFPAERLAYEAPVSELDGAVVIVTSYVEGGRPTDAEGRVESGAVFRELGGLLGRLHALPAPEHGAAARPGGSEEHDGGFHVGRPGQDLAAAMGFLVDVEDRVPDAGRAAFDTLTDLVEQCDDAEGLPEALTHGNFHAWATVGAPGALSVVGWAGSGRGPRLPALAWLLTTAAEAGEEHVDEVVRGYAEHVELTADELDRLPGILAIRPLWLTCLDYREAVRRGKAPVLADGWTPPWGLGTPDRARAITDRVAVALRSR